MIFSLLLSWIIQLHPIHLSVTEVNYSEKDKTFQITSRIFIDDLELAIRAFRKNENLNLLEPGNGSTTDQLASDYLKKHLRLSIDGKPVHLNYLGSEVEDVALIFYIETPVIRKFKTIETFDDVIQEIHADQSNLIHVTYRGQIKSVRLIREHPSASFVFETK